MKYYDTSVIVTVLQKSCDTNNVTMESLHRTNLYNSQVQYKPLEMDFLSEITICGHKDKINIIFMS